MITPIFDIFELRKSGKFETAYNAARENFAHHRGHYTNLCMFWCALDFARYLMNNGRHAEMPNVLGQMVTAYHLIADHSGQASTAANQLLNQYYNTL